MPQLVLPLLSLLCLALVAGCAPSLGPQQCRTADWEAVGMADGLEGRGGATLQRHVSTCAAFGIFPDTKAYEAGLARGNDLFCTAETGYRLGRSGRSFPSACAGDAAEKVRPAYNFGRRYRELDQEIGWLRRELREGAREGTLLPSDSALLPARIRRLERERRSYAYWPPVR